MRKGMGNRCWALVVVAAVTLLAASAMPSHGDNPVPLRTFMEVKLQHSQAILGGLTREDFSVIGKRAQDLSLLTMQANWDVMQTEEYLEQSRAFRRSADALKQAAEKRNLDGATVAYVDMTLKCVACHKYVRNAKAERP